MKLLPLALLLAGCALRTLPTDEIHDSRTKVAAVLPYVGSGARCSAVAVKPTVLTTAGHCVDAIGMGDVVGGGSVVGYWHAPGKDAALLHVDAPVRTYSPAGPRIPATWEPLEVVGYGCDSTEATFRRAQRRAFMLGRDVDGSLVLDGNVCHGDSGGGVFDGSGLLLGILVTAGTLSDNAVVGIVGAEPLESILDGIASPRGWVGVAP